MTPSSKVVGDLAQFMVQNKLSAKDVLDKAGELSFPNSVVQYLQGHIGQPYGGFPEPLRTKVIKDKPRIDDRPGKSLPPLDFDKIEEDLKKQFPEADITEKDVMSAALYNKVTKDYLTFRSKFGPVEKLDTRIFFVGPKVGEEFEIPLAKGKI